tara:strand:+ start:201 stop:491 length:291 start_codon:yes stop_codon:yes gene_type:complete
MLTVFPPPESESIPETVEVQAMMPRGVMLEVNEAIRAQTGELLFGMTSDNDLDFVWGNINPENVSAVCAAIEQHGGILRGSYADTLRQSPDVRRAA